jgi:hypothetical protein
MAAAGRRGRAMTSPPSPEIDASHAVLLEVLSILGLYAGALVVVGGWVPYLAFPGRGHSGSLDVDVAIDGRRVPASAYASIRKRLIDRGYVQVYPHHSIFRRTTGEGGVVVSVKLDIITGGDSGGEPELIQDLRVGGLRGVEIALDHAATITLEGRLPDGSTNTVDARIVTVPAFLCMKAHALNERVSDKDGYDVYFRMDNFDGGPRALAEAIRPVLGDPGVKEAVGLLRRKFATIDSQGPVGAGRFAAGLGDDDEQVRRRAIELAQRVFEHLPERRPVDH